MLDRMRVVSSCGLFCLVLAAACSDERAAFNEVDSARADDALGAPPTSSKPGPRGTSPVSVERDARLADAGTGSGSIGLPPSVSMTPTGTLLCGNTPCQCNNGIDDDGDGNVDGFDVECTGGIDDDESSFATGIPGDNRDPKWQDCFFDGNSGAGDDRCRYPTECLTGELSLSDAACAVTQACRDNCLPRTPNGCDCFGCCAIALPGKSEVTVLLTDRCSAEKIGDTDACPVCVPNPECSAPPNQPAPDPTDPSQPGEPAEPDPGAPTFSCEGRTECSGSESCPVGQFCSQGCCLVVIE
jgi:hypothetical protein